MENICKTFLNTGDVVLVESPSFSGTVRTIQGYGAEVVAVPMTSEGANVEFIKDVITSLSKENKKIKLFYTIPDFHNPLGIITSLHCRKEILSLCEKNQILVVEDAAYTEIYYDNPPPPSYYSLSDGYGVIKMSSFSKITVTGLRAGWIQARKELTKQGKKVRVVSMPCVELFEEQSESYKEEVLPSNIRKRIVVEAAESFGWHKYIGLDGDSVTMNSFGASAPGGTCMDKFGFTVKNVIEKAQSLLK